MFKGYKVGDRVWVAEPYGTPPRAAVVVEKEAGVASWRVEFEDGKPDNAPGNNGWRMAGNLSRTPQTPDCHCGRTVPCRLHG